MDLRRIRTCTRVSRRAELHHSSRPCDQWGQDSVAKLLSILINDTTLHCSCCFFLVVCQRLRDREWLSEALLEWISNSFEGSCQFVCSGIIVFSAQPLTELKMCLLQIMLNQRSCVCRSSTVDKKWYSTFLLL